VREEGERTWEGGLCEKLGPGMGARSSSQFPVPSSSSSTRRSGQDRTEIVEGQGTWMARTGWAFVRGARASVFGGGEILLTARDRRRSGTEGQQEQRDRRQAGAEQGGIQSNNENEHDYFPSRNCVKGSATPPDCPPPCPPRQSLPSAARIIQVLSVHRQP
jgi:hypothetical protein